MRSSRTHEWSQGREQVSRTFAVVPDDLLERDELSPWFVRSWEFAGTLEPK